MTFLAYERLRAWWRLHRRLCPGCDEVKPPWPLAGCRICYGWASKPKNKGKIPTDGLVGNWRRRYAHSKKSSEV